MKSTHKMDISGKIVTQHSVHFLSM